MGATAHAFTVCTYIYVQEEANTLVHGECMAIDLPVVATHPRVAVHR